MVFIDGKFEDSLLVLVLFSDMKYLTVTGLSKWQNVVYKQYIHTETVSVLTVKMWVCNTL